MRRTAPLFVLASTLGVLACADSPTNPAGPQVESSPEQPPRVPATAALAFVSTRDGAEHIYVANADGSEVTRVTQGSSPAWSWDGRKIALVREASSAGPAGIYVMNYDGSALRYVGGGRSPAWSPDGRILFIEIHWGRTGVVNVMNADGSGVTQLYSRGATTCAAWPCTITLVPEAGAAAWSPGARSIAFREGATVFRIDADGSDLRALDELPDLGSEPAWSPSGSRIAVVTDPGVWKICSWVPGSQPGPCRPGPGIGKSSVVYSYDLATGARRVIPAIFPLSGAGAGNPDWSPDGSQLLFDLRDATLSCMGGGCPDAGSGGPRRIYTMSVETGEVRRLIPEAVNPAVADYEDLDAVWSRVVR